MASEARRRASNAGGDMFVDESCIDCGACRWIAPDTFDAYGGYARVHPQLPGHGAPCSFPWSAAPQKAAMREQMHRCVAWMRTRG
jgi:hypothetical protein